MKANGKCKESTDSKHQPVMGFSFDVDPAGVPDHIICMFCGNELEK